MPPLPPVSKVLRCDLAFTAGANSRVRNRIFFSFTGVGPTVADLTTLAGTIATAWGTNMNSLVDNTISLTGVELTDLSTTTAAQTTATASQTGTVTGNILFLSAAAVIRFKINRRYRGGHPRFYLVGIPGGDLSSGNQLTSAYQSSLATGFRNFITGAVLSPPANIGTMAHVNVSYFSGFINKTFPSGRTHPVPVSRGTPLVDVVQSYSVNPLLGSQRRRNLQSA